MHWILIAAIGAGVGFLGGMFGKGGSAIATPLLAAIGVPPIIAVASPLPATVPGTLLAYRNYRHTPHADSHVIRWSIAFGVPATIAGSLLTRWVDGGFLVGLTEIVVALLGAQIVLRGERPERPKEELDTSKPRLAAVAITVGLLAGLLANAGGFMLVPLYLGVLKLRIKTALACSLAVASALAVPGTVVHAALGHIDWRVAGVFGLASIPLSSMGSRTALRMNPARLERVYGIGLFTLGAALFVVN